MKKVRSFFKSLILLLMIFVAVAYPTASFFNMEIPLSLDNQTILVIAIFIVYWITMYFTLRYKSNGNYLNTKKWILIFALSTLYLGVLGLMKENIDFFNALYLSITLFSLESLPDTINLNIFIHITRYLAIVTTFTTVIYVLFRDLFVRIKLLSYSRHTIICGLSNRTVKLANDLRHNHHHKVVIIELDPDNGHINDESINQRGVTILIGNATDISILKKARIKKAINLVAFIPDDEINKEILLAAHTIPRKKKLNCFIHIYDEVKLDIAKRQRIFNNNILDENAQIDARAFNIYELGAIDLLTDYDPVKKRDSKYNYYDNINDPIHIIACGNGSFLTHLIKQVARYCHYPNLKKTKLTVVTNNEKINLKTLNVKKVLDDNSCIISEENFLKNVSKYIDANIMYICFDDDDEGMHFLLELIKTSLDKDIKVIYAAPQKLETTKTDLKQLFLDDDENEEDKKEISLEIELYPLLDQVCQEEHIISNTITSDAKELNQLYSNKDDWNEIDDVVRDYNRYLAYHLPVKQKYIFNHGRLSKKDQIKILENYIQLIEQYENNQIQFQNLPEKVRVLTIMEHNRWLGERHVSGFKTCENIELKSNVRRVNPNLCEWNDLKTKGRDLLYIKCCLTLLLNKLKKNKKRKKTYKPKPVKIKDKIITFDNLCEIMAKHVHDTWAQERIKQGWTYGEERDDHKKEHPNLIPYEDLPDEEKVYDRKTAMETIKLIRSLGYEIKKKSD